MNTRTTVILAVVCAGIFAVLWFVVRPFESTPPAADKPAAGARALIDPKPEGTDRIEVSRRDGKSFVFVRDGKEDWALADPVEAGASKFEVDALLDAVAALRIDRVFDRKNPQRPGPEVTGLDKPLATVKLLKEGKPQAEVRIGSRVPTGRGNYVQLPGSDDIGVSENDLTRHFTRRLDEYRDKRVLKFEFADVQRVTLQGLANFELVRAEAEQWTLEAPVHAQADKAKADSLIRPLTNLRADQFVEDPEPVMKRYGLDQPRLTVTVHTKETTPARARPGDPDTKPADTQPTVESRTYELAVGGATDPKEESYFARIGGKPWIFTIRQDTFKALSPTLDEVRDKTLARVDPARVKKVEALTPGGEMTFLMGPDGQWRFADGTEADTTFVGELVKGVGNLRATEFIDPKKEILLLDWDKPQGRITLTQEGQLNPVTVLVGPASASGKMIYLRNPAQEGVAAVADNLARPLLQPPVSYRSRRALTFARDAAADIRISRGDTAAPVIRMARRDSEWRMVEPIEGPTDPENLPNLLQDLSALTARRVVAAGDRAKYGLDKPGVTVEVTMKSPATAPAKAAASRPATLAAASLPASGPERDVAILKQLIEYQKTNPSENPKATEMLKDMLGKKLASMPASAPAVAASAPARAVASAPAAGPTHTLHMTLKGKNLYACVDGGDLIYELDPKVFNDAIAEMYPRQLTRFQPADVTEIAFRTRAGQITLRKTDGDWKYLEDPLVPIDASRVDDVLTAFRDLKTHHYADYDAPDLEKYGLGANAERVIFTTKDGRKTEILVSPMGPASDPSKSNRFGVLAGTRRVFFLKTDQTAKFRQKIEDLQKRPPRTGTPPEGA